MFSILFILVPAAAILPPNHGISHCSDHQFMCNNGRCIPETWRCDSEPDCTDGSDETGCSIIKCKPNEFECEPGSCIPDTWVCDGQLDCTRGLDEFNCSKTCSPDQFKCEGSDWCIQKIWICDGDNDCRDGSDEINCPPTKCGSNDFECSDKHCISKTWRCDGDYDCPDHSDEQDCPNPAFKPTDVCRHSEYLCNDWLTCIPKTSLCDGHADCPDNDDESEKVCRRAPCQADEFQCRNHYCISANKHCDQISDCPDNSDEDNCTISDGLNHFTKLSCREDQFECDGHCIPMQKVCDGRADCLNNEDEPADKCHINECLVNNGGCNHNCIDTRLGYHCSCRPGYKLVTNNTCEDINECENPGSCSHKCINEDGTFKCECFQGYLKDPYDKTRCKPTEGHTYLLFTRKHDIRKLSVDHHEMTSIVNNTKSAAALDFIIKSGMIFWSDFTDHKIYKAPIDEGHVQTVVINNDVKNCDGLAIDWIYDHIYWTDTGVNTIEVANLDGTNRQILYSVGLDEPRAIAVNPLDGWMYWSDWGENGRIERGGMDGSLRHVIVSYDVKWPNGLTLDLVRQKLYWVDAKLNSIYSVNYDGSERTIILKSSHTLHHPFSISVFEDYVYWTDWEKQTIFRANKFNGANVTALTAGKKIQSLMVVHAYHPYRQPNGTNHCASSGSSKCSHLCLPAPQTDERSPKISCVCPKGLTLGPDGFKCIAEVSTSPVKDPHIMSPTVGIQAISSDPYSSPVAIVIMSISLFLVFTSVVAYIIYRNYLRKNITNMNFDNPVYRKTTEDRFSLVKAYPQSPYLLQNDTTDDAQESLTSYNKNDYV